MAYSAEQQLKNREKLLSKAIKPATDSASAQKNLARSSALSSVKTQQSSLPSLSGTDAAKTTTTTTPPPATTTPTQTKQTTADSTPAYDQNAYVQAVKEHARKLGMDFGQYQQFVEKSPEVKQKFIDQINGTAVQDPTKTVAEDEAATGNVPAEGTPGGQYTPASVQSEIELIESNTNSTIDEINTLQNSSLTAEADYREAMTELASRKYDQEAQNYTRLEDLHANILAQKTAAINAATEQERRDAKMAYDESVRALEVQRERTKKAFEDKEIETKLSNTKRQLETESMIAALGGFGSLSKNKEIIQLTLENDRLLNSVMFEKDMADREITNEFTSVTDDYQDDLMTIEENKQTAMMQAYNEFEDYVTAVQNNRELSIEEKYSTIKTAQAEYKVNVAEINQASFEQRYETSEAAATAIRDLKFRTVDAATSALYGYVTDAQGRPILDEYGNKVELPPEAKSDLQWKDAVFDDYGRVITPPGTFDPSTGEFRPDTSFSVPSNIRQSGGVNFSSPETKAYLEDIFGVGEVGGWCGVYSSSISTAPAVGDNYTEKMTHVVPGEIPSAGDKLILPLGVTDKDKGYGHVATVIGYNTATGDVYVVESNADGRQNEGKGEGVVTLGTYNINTLTSKYGAQAFGFVPGELKEPYASAVAGLEMTQGSIYGQDDVAILGQEAVQKGYTTEAEINNYIRQGLNGITLPENTKPIEEEFDSITKLQTQYKPLVQEVRKLEEGYSTARDFDVKTTNPYSDQALIFAFMKVLDPSSVVREGEYATAVNNASLLQSLAGQWQKSVSGEGLLKESQRKNILAEMKRIYSQKRAVYEEELTQAKTIGEQFGIDPNLYLSGYDMPEDTYSNGVMPGGFSTDDEVGKGAGYDTLPQIYKDYVDNGSLSLADALSDYNSQQNGQ